MIRGVFVIEFSCVIESGRSTDESGLCFYGCRKSEAK